jgi:hypothetical protein
VALIGRIIAVLLLVLGLSAHHAQARVLEAELSGTIAKGSHHRLSTERHTGCTTEACANSDQITDCCVGGQCALDIPPSIWLADRHTRHVPRALERAVHLLDEHSRLDRPPKS